MIRVAVGMRVSTITTKTNDFKHRGDGLAIFFATSGQIEMFGRL